MTAGQSTGLFSREVGTAGPRVVLLHGLFGQGRNWTQIAKALSDEFRLTLVDLPDHGRSGWSDHVSYAAMAGAVADLIGSLLEGDADPGPVAVLGHSMGGKVAMSLALARPDLVARLVVADIAPIRYERMSSFGAYVAGMRSLDLTALPDRATADRGLQPYVPDATIRAFLLQNLHRDGPGWRWAMNLRRLGDELDTLGDWPDYDGAPYEGPVLWLAGADSDYVTPASGKVMRALFPRAQLVKIKRAGHWLHADQPEIFVATVRRFLHPR